MSDGLFYVLREMRRKKYRTACIVLGYAAAAIALVFVLVSIRTTRDLAVETLWDIGAHTMAFIPARYTSDSGGQANALFLVNNTPSQLLSDDIVDTLRQSPNIADACPYLLLSVRAEDGNEWTLGGFDPARPMAFAATMVAPSQVVHGSFLTPDKTEGIMVEQEFAKAYGLSVGSKLRIGGAPYPVAAVVAPPLRPGKANIYMAIAELRKLAYGLTGIDVGHSANAVLVESKGAHFHKAALADIQKTLGQKTQMTTYGCSNPGALVMRIHENAAELLILCAVIGFFALLLRAQLGYIAGRRREIAIMRAIGWGSKDIAFQILASAVLQATVGGVPGCAVGLFASQSSSVSTAIGMRNAMPLSAGIALAGCVFGLVMFAGLAAGLLPAWSASRLRPADVLRRP